MKTIIHILMDRSGSMAGKQTDVVGGVNQFIADQQKQPGEDTIALTRFDSEGIENFRPSVRVAAAKPITLDDFQPRGGTPVLDAVGETILSMESTWRAEKPDRAIMVIVTDGEENQSRKFKKHEIKSLIEARERSGLWAFIYLGAGVNAFHEAASIGVSFVNTAHFADTGIGTRSAYAAASNSVASMKMSGVMDANLGGTLDEQGKLDKGNVAKAQAAPAPGPVWTPPPASGTPGTWTPPA